MKESNYNSRSSLEGLPDIERASVPLLALPFDAARVLYATGVRVGFIERSMLAWAKFERTLDALERLTLGPWARRV